MGECKHLRAETFTQDGADHIGVDLFVKCPDCRLRGPHVECHRATPELRRMVWNAWNDDRAQQDHGRTEP